MTVPELVWCHGGNRKYAEIAVGLGYRYGLRLPDTAYHPVWFADQDWRNPDRCAYMRALEHHRPEMATVLDWEREEQLPEVLSWAEEAAQWCRRVVIVPKVPGGVKRIPDRVSGASVVLGYSVPTSYGATPVPVYELFGRSVHLRGGSPQAQMGIVRRLASRLSVVSADGNMAARMATRRAAYWVPGNGTDGSRWWQSLSSTGDERRDGAPEEAVRRSLVNIRDAWEVMPC